MKAIHFGAGNIGRGFIGFILHENNYDLIFVDINKDIINLLNQKKKYNIHLLKDPVTKINVDNVSALNSVEDLDQVILEIMQADLITTSLGQNNLTYIVKIIISGIEKRIDNNINTNLDIIACENGIKVSSYLKEIIYQNLTNKQIDYCNKFIGFVDSAVDRIVPNQENQNLLDVQVEAGYEWVLDKTQIKRNNQLENVIYTDNLLFFNQRKLLTVNLAHAQIGYMGHYYGYKYVNQAIEDPIIYKSVQTSLLNIRTALSLEFDFDDQEQQKYIALTIERFKNKLIFDEVTRVARNPELKLGINERFIKPLLQLENAGLNPSGLIVAVAYALKYDFKEDQQSQKIISLINDKGIDEAIKSITSIDNQELIDKIVNQYNLIK